MPSHNHLYVENGHFTVEAGNAATAPQWGNWTNATTGVVTGKTGGGAKFLPYHYGVYVWYRTA